MKHITLEMSLKPFKKIEDDYIRKVCKEFFTQWNPLLKNAETVSVMLWSSDGSEILDYRKNSEDTFCWSCYAGNANPDNTIWHKDHDPDGISPYAEGYYYTNDIPVMTYGVLKKIVASIKEEGKNKYFQTFTSCYDDNPKIDERYFSKKRLELRKRNIKRRKCN